MAAKKKLSCQLSTAQDTIMVGIDRVYPKNGKIAIDGNVMGTMPGTFYFRPVDLYKMVKMVDWNLIKAVPGILKQGKKEFKSESKDA